MASRDAGDHCLARGRGGLVPAAHIRDSAVHFFGEAFFFAAFFVLFLAFFTAFGLVAFLLAFFGISRVRVGGSCQQVLGRWLLSKRTHT